MQHEYGTASNIKSHTNKLSVQSAITSVLVKLRTFNKMPNNGLIIFCGSISLGPNKDKKVTIDIIPPKPVKQTTYKCDSRFHTNELREMLVEDETFGFIITDGNGSLFGTVNGDSKKVLNKFTTELPKKHGKGGQSAARFGRLRMEARHNYIRKVCELTTNYFITDNKPNVTKLILAGSADFKDEVRASHLFDQRLKQIVHNKTFDVSNGGDVGFNETIKQSSSLMGDIKLVREVKILSRLEKLLMDNSEKTTLGVKNTINVLEMGAIETLIVWEDHSEKISVEDDEYPDGQNIVDYLLENEPTCKICLVTDKTDNGMRFIKGLGGIAAILKYEIDPTLYEEQKENEEEEIGKEFNNDDFM